MDCWIDAPPHRQVVQARALLRADDGVDGAEISRYCTRIRIHCGAGGIALDVEVHSWGRGSREVAPQTESCRPAPEVPQLASEASDVARGPVMRPGGHAAAAELLLLGL